MRIFINNNYKFRLKKRELVGFLNIRKCLARAKLSTRLLHSKRYLIVLNGVLPTSEEPTVLSLGEHTYKKRRP